MALHQGAVLLYLQHEQIQNVNVKEMIRSSMLRVKSTLLLNSGAATAFLDVARHLDREATSVLQPILQTKQ